MLDAGWWMLDQKQAFGQGARLRVSLDGDGYKTIKIMIQMT
jgi:hypothetical protein